MQARRLLLQWNLHSCPRCSAVAAAVTTARRCCWWCVGPPQSTGLGRLGLKWAPIRHCEASQHSIGQASCTAAAPRHSRSSSANNWSRSGARGWLSSSTTAIKVRGRQPAEPQGIATSSGGVVIAAAVAAGANRSVDGGVGRPGCGGCGGAPALTFNLHDTTGGYSML